MPLRMRSKKPIANAPWCTTQVFLLCPHGTPDCVLSICVYFFLISFVLWHHRIDRHSSATPEVQKEEEKKFKEVGEAFTILSDPKKKTRYDNGHDLDDDGSFSGRGKGQLFFFICLVFFFKLTWVRRCEINAISRQVAWFLCLLFCRFWRKRHI